MSRKAKKKAKKEKKNFGVERATDFFSWKVGEPFERWMHFDVFSRSPGGSPECRQLVFFCTKFTGFNIFEECKVPVTAKHPLTHTYLNWKRNKSGVLGQVFLSVRKLKKEQKKQKKEKEKEPPGLWKLCHDLYPFSHNHGRGKFP